MKQKARKDKIGWVNKPPDVWILHREPVTGTVTRLASGVYETSFDYGNATTGAIIIGTEHQQLANACHAVIAKIDEWFDKPPEAEKGSTQ